MNRGICLVGLGATVLWVLALTASALPFVELRAEGAFPDHHDITVPSGTPVRLLYTISYADQLAGFQNNITVSFFGGGAISGSPTATDDGTWWGAQATTSLSPLTFQPATSMYFLLGETSFSTPPFSYSNAGEASLAYIDLTPLAGTVQVDLTSLANPNATNDWTWSTPDGKQSGSMAVDLDNSLPIVIIRVGDPTHKDSVPEPTSLVLLAAGIGAALSRRRRRRG